MNHASSAVPRFSLPYGIPTAQVDENPVTLGTDFRQDDSTGGKRYEIRARKKISIFQHEGEPESLRWHRRGARCARTRCSTLGQSLETPKNRSQVHNHRIRCYRIAGAERLNSCLSGALRLTVRARTEVTGSNMTWPFSFSGSRSVRSWWPWVPVGWSSLILVQVTQNYTFCVEVGMPWSWAYSLRYAVTELTFWAIMTGVIAHWAQTYSLGGVKRGKNLAVLVLLTGATLLIHASYRVPLHRVIYNDPEPRPLLHLFTFQLIDNSLTDAAVFWAIVGISQAIRSARQAQQREHELTKAQLEMLKSQLQPHFLFNTLNSVSWLMRKDVEAADNVITSLSTFLRTTLAIPGSEEVTLRDELQVLRLYLEIEEARFQGRLTVVMNVEPSVLDCKVPGLLLQPIVENAVRHGVARIEGPGVVEIGAGREGSELCLWILDNGPGMATPVVRREGIGTANARARLEKYYGLAQSLRFGERVGGGARVDIRLPFRLSNRQENRGELRETAIADC